HATEVRVEPHVRVPATDPAWPGAPRSTRLPAGCRPSVQNRSEMPSDQAPRASLTALQLPPAETFHSAPDAPTRQARPTAVGQEKYQYGSNAHEYHRPD